MEKTRLDRAELKDLALKRLHGKGELGAWDLFHEAKYVKGPYKNKGPDSTSTSASLRSVCYDALRELVEEGKIEVRDDPSKQGSIRTRKLYKLV